jgi:hypothetical protein
MRRALLAVGVLACSPRPVCVVDDVSPSYAAEISRIYHDRVTVLSVRRPDGTLLERTGALVDDGRALVTWNDRKVTIDSADRIRLRIDYLEGDHPVVGRGVVHKGASGDLIGVGLAFGLIGALGLSGVMIGASQCPPAPIAGSWPSFGPSDHDFCTTGYALLGFVSVLALLASIPLVIRGAVPTNLTLSF